MGFPSCTVERSSGRRTDVYDKIKQMNAEIRALSGVFLGCEVVSVRPYGRVDSSGNRSADRAP